MNRNDASPEQEVGIYVPMEDAKVDAIGTLLATIGRVFKYQRHWLSVAQFLISGSLTIAMTLVQVVRSVRERAIALCCMVATPFVLLLRHLSKPPLVWAGQ